MLKIARRLVVKLLWGDSSEPFISGDLFKSFSDCEYWGVPSELTSTKSSVIFVNSMLVELLTTSSLLKLDGHTIVIGNSDRDFDGDFDFSLIKCRRIYVQNLLTPSNEVVRILPLGIENLQLGRNGLPILFSRIFFRIPKQNRILLGPFSNTHSERDGLICSLSKNVNVECVKTFMNPLKYAFKASRFKYVACPRGNGVDTHRFWESLYRGSIPIVLESEWARNISKLGIPVIQISSWSDSEINRAILEFPGRFDPKEIPALWKEYWEKEFRNSGS